MPDTASDDPAEIMTFRGPSRSRTGMFWSQALAKSRPCSLNYDRPHNTVAAIRGGGQWRALASAWAARHCQTKFYTASWRSGPGGSPTAFAEESPTRSARFDAENDLNGYPLHCPVVGEPLEPAGLTMAL